MDEFISDLRTVHWWLGVVVVGVAINIFSAHLPQWLGTGCKMLRFRWMLWGERDKARFERDVLSVMQSDMARTAFLSRSIAAHFRCGVLSLVGLGCIYIVLYPSGPHARTLFSIGSICLLLAACVYQFRAQYAHGVIQTAAERPKQQQCEIHEQDPLPKDRNAF
jgi:hypothetical protein